MSELEPIVSFVASKVKEETLPQTKLLFLFYKNKLTVKLCSKLTFHSFFRVSALQMI